VVEPRMGDGRRVLLSDLVEDEIQRRNHQEAVAAGGPEDDLREFHAVLRASVGWRDDFTTENRGGIQGMRTSRRLAGAARRGTEMGWGRAAVSRPRWWRCRAL